MGGFGSGGYRFDKKSVVEDCITLNIFKLYQQRIIAWNAQSSGVFTAGSSKMGYTLLDNVLTLRYTFKTGKHADQAISEAIRIVETQPHFGGRRLWFRCPHCQHRAGKLYLAPGQRYYLCRTCGDLTYRERQEHSHGATADLIAAFKRSLKLLGRSF